MLKSKTCKISKSDASENVSSERFVIERKKSSKIMSKIFSLKILKSDRINQKKRERDNKWKYRNKWNRKICYNWEQQSKSYSLKYKYC